MEYFFSHILGKEVISTEDSKSSRDVVNEVAE